MGFFASGSSKNKKDSIPSIQTLHKLQCRVCPLDRIRENENPHMPASGAKEPLIYILGEAPGKAEDARDEHFVGKSGKLIRERIPKKMLPHIRFNNVVRTRPIDNATPETIEIECCRPSVEKDIVESKPKAILGFGAVPLHWALKQTGIYKWRGKRIPVDIGGHVCWFYPIEHPASLLRKGRRAGKNGDSMRPTDIGSEDERAFTFDLQRAFDEVEELPEPYVFSQADIEAGVELIPCTEAGLDRLEQLIDWAIKQPVCGVDLETNTLRPYGKPVFYKDGNILRFDPSRILSAAIGTPQKSFSFAIDHRQAKWTKAQRTRVIALYTKFLKASVSKSVHNLPFEDEWHAYFFGQDVITGSWECTYQQAATIDERFGALSLDSLCLEYFGVSIKNLSPLDRKDLDDEPLEDVLRYNAIDAKFHCLLFIAQHKRLAELGLQSCYESNRRSVPTLVRSQLKGTPISQEENMKLDDEYVKRMDDAEDEIMAIPGVAKFKTRKGDKFNPTSNKHLSEYLHSVGIHDFESVDESELNKIDHPIIKPLIKLRKASKVHSTYILPYRKDSEDVWPDGRIHPIINPYGTVTNRTSSDSPNVQNMPKRNADSKRIRKMLKANLCMSIDYGQIQARGIAMMSKDKAFVKSLWERYDVHQEWAERLAKAYPRIMDKFKDEKNPMKAWRGDVKNQWTFPLFFGSQLGARSEQLGIPEDILEPEYNKFWKVFSGVRDWQERLLKEYQDSGIVRHMDGRLNRAPISLNQVINYPVQGIERQIVMNAMNKLSEHAAVTGDMNFQPNLMIHDDLTNFFEDEVAVEKVDYYVEEYVDRMLEIDFDFINVPLTVEVSIGPDMYSMEEVLIASSDDWKKAA